MGAHLRGGKTTPRLLQDLIGYDPRRPPHKTFNVLTDIPFYDVGKEEEDPLLSKTGCRHQWALKRSQCDLPKDGNYEPKISSHWVFACYCSLCRSHLDLCVGYNSEISNVTPCPTKDWPLHHFVHRPERSKPRSAELNEVKARHEFAWHDLQHFECSAIQCGAQLRIQFKPPRLTNDWVSLLIDNFIIKARAEKAIAKDPEKFEGYAAPTPGTVLENLARLLSAAMHYEEGRRPYQRNGRNWLLNFGEPCAGLMEYMGFTSDVRHTTTIVNIVGTNGVQGGDWQWPRINPSPELPYTDPLQTLLDDVQKEVIVLMSQRPDDERRSAKFDFVPELATKEVRLALGCPDYKQSPKARIVDLTVDEHPFYAGLGCVADFHDDLIYFGYERQIAIDSLNIPYYLECLQTIAEGRTSEDLSMKAVIEESEGRISLRDVRLAYQHFGYDVQTSGLVDETIIGSFRARLSDSPRQEAELRRDLKIIGQHRRSPKIENVASQAVNSYEQALSFLDAADETSDEFITSMYTLKVDGKPSEDATARQAVAHIANHRKSRALKHWLNTGTLGEVEMDIGQAYARLDISDRTLEDEMVLVAYDVHAEEQPSQAEDLNRALAAIAKVRKSKILMERLGMDIDASTHPVNEWPVGIDNIGNTCYLNSLLQFYFAVRPLRDLILKIDDFQTPTDDESLKSKRVGSRIVSRREVDRAKKTVHELRKLFRGLITSPKSSFRPDTELARLTLLTPKAEIARRQSVMNKERPTLFHALGTTNGVVVEGPAEPPQSQAIQEDIEMLDGGSTNALNAETPVDDQMSNSSSETLVEGPAAAKDAMLGNVDAKEQQRMILDNKENLPPSKADKEDVPGDVDLQPLAESSPSRMNEEPTLCPNVKAEKEAMELTNDMPVASMSAKGPPNRPPPVPPRPKPSADEALKEAEFGAQQQDVGEINGNVLFQLQCAIKPESVDETGEQIDQVKRLFFGKQKSYTTNKAGIQRTKEEYISDIKVNVAAGPCDIYAALDGAFDVQDVEVAGGSEPQYFTISHLPPILQIHIQRAQFDPQAKKGYKSESHLEFNEVIYLDRYIDSADPELAQRRQESWEWKRQLGKLEARRSQLILSDINMEMPEVLESAHGYLRQLDSIGGEHAVEVPTLLLETLRAAAEEARTELDALQAKIRDLTASISSQFNDLREIPYQLAAVFIHRGTSNAGHYWIYIYDFDAKIWRKYNDEKVTKVKDIIEIFGASTEQRPATPYFLVYVKDEWKEKLVEPLCRDVVEPPPEEHKDTIMEDYVDIPLQDQIADTYTFVRPDALRVVNSEDNSGPSGIGWDNGQARDGTHW
ncbi:MAG: hypothetical protein Q9217_006011 [Psora testacea]